MNIEPRHQESRHGEEDVVGDGGREEDWSLEGGTQAVVGQSGPWRETLLAALWTQPPRLRCLETPGPPALHDPLVPLWSCSGRVKLSHCSRSIEMLGSHWWNNNTPQPHVWGHVRCPHCIAFGAFCSFCCVVKISAYAWKESGNLCMP